MLIALNEDRLVLAENAQNGQKYYCPGCGKEVILRRGKYKITHYAHKRGSDCGFSEGETEEHLRGKKQIYKWAQKNNWKPRLEIYLPMIAQRPDILLDINGQNIAIEFQCSPLSLEKLLARNQGYSKLKMPVLWILGSPYLRNLRNKKVAQFTQVFKKQFVLLFWDIKRARLIVDQRYWHCSYSNLKFDKETILMQQISMLENKQFRFPNKEIRKLSLKAKILTGYTLPQCPLVCHDLIASWPAMSIPVIIWRIGVVLELKRFPLFFSWNAQEWIKFLVQVGKREWLYPGCLPSNMLQKNIINQYTKELVEAKVIYKADNQFILRQRPQWFDNPQVKLQSVKEKRRL